MSDELARGPIDWYDHRTGEWHRAFLAGPYPHGPKGQTYFVNDKRYRGKALVVVRRDLRRVPGSALANPRARRRGNR